MEKGYKNRDHGPVPLVDNYLILSLTSMGELSNFRPQEYDPWYVCGTCMIKHIGELQHLLMHGLFATLTKFYCSDLLHWQ